MTCQADGWFVLNGEPVWCEYGLDSDGEWEVIEPKGFHQLTLQGQKQLTEQFEQRHYERTNQ